MSGESRSAGLVCTRGAASLEEYRDRNMGVVQGAAVRGLRL